MHWTLITGGVWLLGPPRVVSGTGGLCETRDVLWAVTMSFLAHHEVPPPMKSTPGENFPLSVCLGKAVAMQMLNAHLCPARHRQHSNRLRTKSSSVTLP